MNVTIDGLVLQMGSHRTRLGDYQLCLRWHGWMVWIMENGAWVRWHGNPK